MKTEVDPTWDGQRPPSAHEVAAVERVRAAFNGARPGGWDAILWRPTLRESRALVVKALCTTCRSVGLPFELVVATTITDPALADSIEARLGRHECAAGTRP